MTSTACIPTATSRTDMTPERLAEAHRAARYFHDDDSDAFLRLLLREALWEIEVLRNQVEATEQRLTEERARTRFWWSESQRKAVKV